MSWVFSSGLWALMGLLSREDNHHRALLQARPVTWTCRPPVTKGLVFSCSLARISMDMPGLCQVTCLCQPWEEVQGEGRVRRGRWPPSAGSLHPEAADAWSLIRQLKCISRLPEVSKPVQEKNSVPPVPKASVSCTALVVVGENPQPLRASGVGRGGFRSSSLPWGATAREGEAQGHTEACRLECRAQTVGVSPVWPPGTGWRACSPSGCVSSGRRRGCWLRRRLWRG